MTRVFFVYDKKRSRIYPSGIGNICVQRDLYEAKYEDESTTKFIAQNMHENLFSVLESRYAHLVSSIIEETRIRATNKTTFKPDSDQKKQLSEMTVHLLFRNPWMLARHLEKEEGYKIVEHLLGSSSDVKIDFENMRGESVVEALAKSFGLQVASAIRGRGLNRVFFVAMPCGLCR